MGSGGRRTGWAKRLSDVVGLVAIAAGTAVLYHTVWGPLRAECREELVQVSAITASLASADKIRSQYDQLKQTVDSLEHNLATVRRAVPQSPEEAELLRQLSEQAVRFDVQITDFRRELAADATTHAQVRFVLKGAGPYPGICRFLDGIDQLQRLVAIESLQIKQEGRAEQDNSDSCSLDLTLLAFYGLKVESPGEEKSDG